MKTINLSTLDLSNYEKATLSHRNAQILYLESGKNVIVLSGSTFEVNEKVPQDLAKRNRKELLSGGLVETISSNLCRTKVDLSFRTKSEAFNTFCGVKTNIHKPIRCKDTSK